jgi:restriction endonuclease S subunit
LRGEARLDAEFWHPDYLQTEQAILAHRWQKLGDLSTSVRKGIFYILASEYTESGVPFYRSSNVGTIIPSEHNLAYISPKKHEEEQTTALRYGDIILAKTGQERASVVLREECNISQDVIGIRLRRGAVNPFYLATYLNTRTGRLQMLRWFQGQVQPHLSLPGAKRILVPLPSDNFQADIEAAICQSKELIEQAGTLYAEAEALLLAELGVDALDLSYQPTYTQSFNQVWAAGRLDADYWRTEYTTLIDCLKPRSHSLLGDLADFANGATPRGANYSQEGIPFLRIQNVGKNRLEVSDVVYIDEATHDELLKRSQLQPRDVLITITGRIGTSAVVPDDMPVGNINQHIVRMRLRSKNTNPYYLAAFLNSKAGHLQTEREAYGTTREALPYYCLERIIVPEASEDLQERIEANIREAEETWKEAKRLLEEAKWLVEQMVLRG